MKDRITRVLRLYPERIKHVLKPTRAQQVAALQGNPKVIMYIKEPCRAAQLLAIQSDPNSLEYIPNPCDDAINLALEKDPRTIRLSRRLNPSIIKRAMLIAEKRNITIDMCGLGED
jgi:hypothetical protein